MKTLVVIPARYASKRFPGKPLHPIAGRSLLSRVAHIARCVVDQLDDVSFVVATDHEEIEQHVRDIDAPVVMTDPELPSGSDRALAAADLYAPDAEFIVNLQGDAPFTPPAHVAAVIRTGDVSTCDVVTPVLRMSWEALDVMREQKKSQPFSGTSCIRRADGQAMWFSKNEMPANRKEAKMREETEFSPVWRHIGLYGYKRDALERFTQLPEGHYERLEGLEQLRFLENGMSIATVEVTVGDTAMWGVDTPEDAAFAEKLIAEHGDPLHN